MICVSSVEYTTNECLPLIFWRCVMDDDVSRAAPRACVRHSQVTFTLASPAVYLKASSRSCSLQYLFYYSRPFQIAQSSKLCLCQIWLKCYDSHSVISTVTYKEVSRCQKTVSASGCLRRKFETSLHRQADAYVTRLAELRLPQCTVYPAFTFCV